MGRQREGETKEDYLARAKEYNDRPEVKARRAELRNRPEFKAHKVKYNAEYCVRPDAKASRAEHRVGPKYKASEFERKNSLTAGAALPFFLMPEVDRWCWLCGGTQLKGMCLDHDHDTGRIRGWSHFHCNVVEGMVRNSFDPCYLTKKLMEMYSEN